MGQWTLIRLWMILGIMTMSLFVVLYLTMVVKLITALVISGGIEDPLSDFEKLF